MTKIKTGAMGEMGVDLKQMQEEAMQNLSNAASENNSEEFGKAFQAWANILQEQVLQEAKLASEGIVQNMDQNVLIGRGVRQLTSEEDTFYQKTIEAMKSNNPKQALAELDVVMPYTVVDAVFEDLVEQHELLSVINFQNTTAITKMLLNTHGNQLATWDKLTTAIVTELTSGFKMIDMTLNKLSAFIPVAKDMLDLGPTWLDRYVRVILSEATAFGLESGIIKGDGKNKPIGMNRQVGDDVTVTGGVYPVKTKIKITDLSPLTYGKLLAPMTKLIKGKDEQGKDKVVSRIVKEVILIVNPTDYLLKIMPATTIRGVDGLYRNNILPFPTRIIQSVEMKEGEAIVGLPKRYWMGIGSEKSGKIDYSDEYRFLEDERVYLTKLYGHGEPLDNNAFAVLDITELEPANVSVKVVKDGAVVPEA